MNNSENEQLPLPQGPFGLPGMGGGGSAHDGTRTPPDKKQKQTRRKEDQAKKSRKINRPK
jgi:hypothetical protein